MQESSESNYLDITEDIIRKIFIMFYAPAVCLSICDIVRNIDKWSPAPKCIWLGAKELAKELMSNRVVKNNKLLDKGQGLKEIGETYFRQTHRVSKQGSFNQSSRK